MELMLNDLLTNQVVFYSVLAILVLLLVLLEIVIMSRRHTIRQSVTLEPIVIGEALADATSEIASVIQEMQQGMENKNLDVTTFEQQQEEKSIISYQELINSAKSKMEVDEQPFVMDEPAININEAIKKFKNTEFISPVYGRVDNNVEYPTIKNFYGQSSKPLETPMEAISKPTIDLEQTLNIKPLTEEIKKNDQFLDALKEFRKNLD